jgi:hypothetical protein
VKHSFQDSRDYSGDLFLEICYEGYKRIEAKLKEGLASQYSNATPN